MEQASGPRGPCAAHQGPRRRPVADRAERPVSLRFRGWMPRIHDGRCPHAGVAGSGGGEPPWGCAVQSTATRSGRHPVGGAAPFALRAHRARVARARSCRRGPAPGSRALHGARGVAPHQPAGRWGALWALGGPAVGGSPPAPRRGLGGAGLDAPPPAAPAPAQSAGPSGLTQIDPVS